MEGHANQWDQVKTKKPKPKPNTTTTTATTGPNSNIKKHENHIGTRSDSTRGGKSRRGKYRGKFGDRSHRTKDDSSTSQQPPKPEEEEIKKPSWASILKGPTKPEPPAAQEQPNVSSDKEITNTITTTTTEIETNEINATEEQLEINKVEIEIKQQQVHDEENEVNIEEQKEITAEETVVENDVENEDDNTNDNDEGNGNNEEVIQSISEHESTVKRVEVTTNETQENQGGVVGFRKVPIRRLKQAEPVVLPSGSSGLENVSMQFGSLNLANGEEQPIQKRVDHVEKETIIEEVKDNGKETVKDVEIIEEVVKTGQKEEVLVQDKKEHIEEHAQKSDISKETTTTTTTLSSTVIDATTTSTTTQASVVTNTTPNVSQQINNNTISTNNPNTTNVNNQSKSPDAPVYQPTQTQPQPSTSFQQSQQQIQPQPVQYQQYQPTFQPPQQHVTLPSTEAHINPYALYPNAIPGNGQMHGFVNPSMVSMPDYYNTAEAQRPVNYYDPNGYNQSPTVVNAHLYNRGKFNNNMQDGMMTTPSTISMMNNTNTIPAVQVPQQPQAASMYGANTGYYSYYYMPNQYHNYQQPPIPQHHHQQQQLPQTQPPPPPPQQQQPPQQSQTTSQTTQKQPQTPYNNSSNNTNTNTNVNTNTNNSSYPMYGKTNNANNTVYQDYTNQQVYDDSNNTMLHSNGSQGLIYDNKQYQNAVPQMQHYLGGNMGQQVQQQSNQGKDSLVNGYDKQQTPTIQQQQPMMVPGNYQYQYQQQQQQPYIYQQQQQQQQLQHQQQPYNPSLPNNSINNYPSRQNQPQQTLYWHHA
ncbi:unnamed protein product [Cunninghamella blakesleeana]